MVIMPWPGFLQASLLNLCCIWKSWQHNAQHNKTPHFLCAITSIASTYLVTIICTVISLHIVHNHGLSIKNVRKYAKGYWVKCGRWLGVRTLQTSASLNYSSMFWRCPLLVMPKYRLYFIFQFVRFMPQNNHICMGWHYHNYWSGSMCLRLFMWPA